MTTSRIPGTGPEGKLKSKWSWLEALVGAKERIKLIAKDMVEHYEKRLEGMYGKAMIVTMSRRIAIEFI